MIENGTINITRFVIIFYFVGSIVNTELALQMDKPCSKTRTIEFLRYTEKEKLRNEVLTELRETPERLEEYVKNLDNMNSLYGFRARLYNLTKPRRGHTEQS